MQYNTSTVLPMEHNYIECKLGFKLIGQQMFYNMIELNIKFNYSTKFTLEGCYKNVRPDQKKRHIFLAQYI